MFSHIKKILKFTFYTLESPNKWRRHLKLLRISLLKRHSINSTKLHGSKIFFPDSLSFLFMEKEIFEKKIYAFISEKKNPYVIDGGANIGLSTIFIKKIYPEAKIIAFEPDNTIANFFLKNIKSFKLEGVTLIKKALWSSETKLYFEGDGADGGKVSNSIKSEIQIETVRLKNYLSEKIDLLKLDIEGSEYEVLIDCRDSLDSVSHMFVEYHSFYNQKQHLDEILNIISEAGFRYYIESVGVQSDIPFIERNISMNMDIQLNIFAYRENK